jgi:alkanesulfonate monooxygenase SsuD/methylene tetrahydromethanopterin reductase-like flavin-dependent oxidoreductase (luciferase family)
MVGAADGVTISVTLPQFVDDPSRLIRGAQRAEALGFDGVYLFDHLFPLEGPDRPIVESTVALGSVVAATSRVTVGTLVLRASLRSPERTSAAVLTASRLSGGRVVCGLGAGDSMSRPEFDAYGVRFPGMGERLRSLEATARLVKGQVPLWIGGTSSTIQRVAAEFADTWNVWNVSAEWLVDRCTRPTAPRISWGGQVLLTRDEEELAAALARRRGPALAATVDTLPRQLARLTAAGVDDFVFSLLGGTWQLFVDEVMPRLGAG